MINSYMEFLFTVVWHREGHMLDASNVYPTTSLDQQSQRTSTWSKTYFTIEQL